MLRAELSRRWSTSNTLPFSRSCNRFNSARSPITIETVTGPDHSHRHTRPTDAIGRLIDAPLLWGVVTTRQQKKQNVSSFDWLPHTCRSRPACRCQLSTRLDRIQGVGREAECKVRACRQLSNLSRQQCAPTKSSKASHYRSSNGVS